MADEQGDNDRNLVNTEKPTIVVRQSIKDLRERVAKGESPYVVIASVLEDDARTLSEYWERALLSQTTAPIPKDLLELYEIDEALARSLDFRAGFQLVGAHWYPEIVRAITPKEPNADDALTTLLANDTIKNIMAELAREFAKADLTSQQIRQSLEVDHSAGAWLNTKMQEESKKQQYLPLEGLGVEKAIKGAVKLYGEITKTIESAQSR